MTPSPQALGPSRASRPTTVWVTGLLMGIIVGRLSTSASGGSSSGSSAAASEGTSECAWAICCLDQCPEVKCSSVLPRSAASLERSGVPSPVEAAERFAAANTDGSDKTTYHSYHLMYGPFLAPYLDKPVVSEMLFSTFFVLCDMASLLNHWRTRARTNTFRYPSVRRRMCWRSVSSTARPCPCGKGCFPTTAGLPRTSLLLNHFLKAL